MSRLPRGFHLVPVAESEASPEFQPDCTRTHRNGLPCDCWCECREWLDLQRRRARTRRRDGLDPTPVLVAAGLREDLP